MNIGDFKILKSFETDTTVINLVQDLTHLGDVWSVEAGGVVELRTFDEQEALTLFNKYVNALT